MQLAVRIWAGVTLVLLLVGAVAFLFVSVFVSLFACSIGACSSLTPDATPGNTIELVGATLGPGFVLALVTWVLNLITLARQRARWRLAFAGGGPLLFAGVFVVFLAFVPPTSSLLPTTAAEYSVWVWKVMMACTALGVVMLMLVLLPPSAWRDVWSEA
jgi:hypothetical protein